jgi:hypothetical protein
MAGGPQVEEAVHELTEAARIVDVDIERGYWREDG